MLPPGNQHLQPSPHGSHEHEHVPSCPRCASTDTKFCYYNNYSLAQPRYFCKACRRYWTRGGALRNVPVGGGCRRRRRSMARRPQSNGHSSPYSCNSGDNSSSTSDSCSSNGQKPNVEINMAAVFANYLNPGSCFKPQAVSESLRNDCLFDVPDQGGCVGFEPLQDSFSHGMLAQDDGFWSSPSYNGNSSDLSTEFTDWEAMVHLKDLDSLPLESISSAVMEDHFQSSSTNQVISDINWSCFDLEGYASSLLPSVDS